MILVTGAAGKTGRVVVRALTARGVAVRAFVRRDAQVAVAMAAGANEARTGELDDVPRLIEAARGMRAIYHICPNVSPDELKFGHAAIAATGAAGVWRFVYHSVLRPQIEAMPHHWAKLRVEEALFASGLDVTVLQPAPYMQNILAGWRSIIDDGVYRVPYAVEARLSMVDLEDVAEAAARVLLDPGHGGATYEMAGTAPLSAGDVADVLGRALGRQVRAEAQTVASWDTDAAAGGLGAQARATLVAMFRYYERHGLAGNPNVLRWLLARPPRGLDEFAARAAAASTR